MNSGLALRPGHLDELALLEQLPDLLLVHLLHLERLVLVEVLVPVRAMVVVVAHLPENTTRPPRPTCRSASPRRSRWTRCASDSTTAIRRAFGPSRSP